MLQHPSVSFRPATLAVAAIAVSTTTTGPAGAQDYAITPLSGVPGPFRAEALNDSGEVAGVIGQATAFVWADGALTTLAFPGQAVTVSDINADGVVLGHVITPGQSDGRVLLWDHRGGTSQLLATPTDVQPSGLNSAQTIVGVDVAGLSGFALEPRSGAYVPIAFGAVPAVGVGTLGTQAINDYGHAVGSEVVFLPEQGFFQETPTGRGGAGTGDAMAVGNAVNEFGRQLRRWRQERRLSQLQLAVEAGVSPRHLSFIETGRSKPSREMVLLLGDHLRLPLREQNAMLLAAGFAPAFQQRAFDSPEMSSVRESVSMVLKSHEPFPAIAVDREWNVVMSNCGASLFAEGVSPELLGPAANVFRLSLHPKGFRRRVLNFAEYARHMVARLRHDATVSGSLELFELLKEIESYPGIISIGGASTNRGNVALPLRIKSALGELSFITMIATFGTPFDVTVSELAVESFFPADPATARLIRERAPVVA